MTRAPVNPDVDAHPKRVILVGRTGLDQSLRRDPSIELIRAADTLDAVGELADPIDAASPRESVVIVAPGAQPELPERGAFIEALRMIDPEVAVLLAGDAGSAPEYDGVIHPDATPRDLNEVLGALSLADSIPQVPTAPPAQAPEREAPSRSPVLPAGPACAGAHDDPGDARVLSAVMRGVDPVPEAVQLIRARLGRDDVVYEPAHKSVPAPAGLVCPVRAESVTIGHLVVRDAGESESDDEGFARALERQAGWLASWVRLHEQQRSLRLAAFTDPLTGAWNRRYFDRYLAAAIEQVRVARLPLTVMVFDIDNFKAYNDRYGHPAGDQILTETVRLLRSVIRPSDRVCRIGGDEFAVIFYEPTGPRSAASRPPESIYRLATRFQTQICNHRFPKLGAEAQGTLTISGGLATYPWDGTDAESLINRADELSMKSKRQGKNVITLGPGAESACKNPSDVP